MSLYPEDEPNKPATIEFGREKELREGEEKMLNQLASSVAGIIQADFNNINERVNGLEKGFEQITGALNQLIESNNKLTNLFNSGQTNVGTVATTPSVNGIDKLETIGKLLDHAGPLLDRIFPSAAPAQTFGIDPNIINEKIREGIMSNFEIGEAIQNNLKSKLMQKTMSKVLSESITSHVPDVL